MPTLETKCFAEVDYSQDSVYHFPSGLPGFEDENAFVFLSRPDTEPLLFMQSLKTPQLCFMLFPVFVVDPQYQLLLEDAELTLLHMPCGSQPRIGQEVLCAAIVRAAGGEGDGPTANLLSPIVVNLAERIGVQAILTGSGYSHRHPLNKVRELAPCS